MYLKNKNVLGLGLSLKLSCWYAFFLSAALLGVFALVYYQAQEFVKAHEAEVLDARLQEYRAWLHEGGLPALKARFDDQRNRGHNSFFIRVIGPETQALFWNMPEGEPSLSTEQLQKLPLQAGISRYAVEGAGTVADWTILTQQAGSGLVLQVGKNSSETGLVLRRLRSLLVLNILPVLLLALAGGTWLTYSALRPLRDLNRTLEGLLARGDLVGRVQAGVRDPELGGLIASFNRLLETNGRLIRVMRESLDNTAHDLRTPLTRLRNAAEKALLQNKSEQDMREGLFDCLEESERVLKMLDVLMDVAEARSGALKLNRSAVSLAGVCRRVVDLYEIVAEEKGITLEVAEATDVRVDADEVRLLAVAGNLVDNAVKYSPSGSRVDLRFRTEGAEAVLEVADRGPGIAAEDLPRIWDRLYRADSSRSQRGLGLGLSLVQAIVQAHGGRVGVESSPGQGSVFWVRLPLAGGR